MSYYFRQGECEIQDFGSTWKYEPVVKPVFEAALSNGLKVLWSSLV